MKNSFICSLLAVAILSACATDPYTGESKVSKTVWGTAIGTAAGAGIGALVGGCGNRSIYGYSGTQTAS